jgi:hypothetical protein
MENNQEILNFKNHLFVLYLYMRDNQRWFEEFIEIIGERSNIKG